jgi:Fur family iron response transcriptional regulator
MSYFDNFIKKLRNSGLRPTKQRLKICEVLFKSEKTFHFTVSDLTKIIEEKLNEKISLATVYNTVHAFKKKGYLKEISISSEKSYFDTNTSSHHHFYDIKDNELTDIDSNQIEIKNIPSPPKGKSIKDIGVVINVENDSQ